MKIISGTKNFLALIILAIVIVALIYFVARPITNAAINHYKSTKDKNAELQSINQNITNLENLKSEIDNLNFTIDKAIGFIPEETNLNEFLIQLENAAKNSKMKLTSIKLSDQNPGSSSGQASASSSETSSSGADSSQANKSTTTAQPTKIINTTSGKQTPIQAQVSGNYSDLIKFLSKMRHLPRFNIIKNLSIQNSTDTKTITASFIVIIFSKN